MEGKCTKFDPVDSATAAEEAKTAPAKAATDTVGQLFFCSTVSPKGQKDKDGNVITVQDCREMGKTMHYNPYFDGKQIAMNQPLKDGQVTFQDGTNATLDQEAHDIVNFLEWAAEPEMEERKEMGIHVMLFLGAMTIFFYLVKKRIWSDLH